MVGIARPNSVTSVEEACLIIAGLSTLAIMVFILKD
jgi:hypothetical protein